MCKFDLKYIVYVPLHGQQSLKGDIPFFLNERTNWINFYLADI